ncbi:MAG: TIR domain-containing protein [Actinophytocola sp.]|uniref:TIR domain-containing protein n=1 Tax=Actinophytocola sp. TaxID=1872138 RepID=UPI001327A60E|nr:TIR domain-containing protein [Actinophytocola sp.]MPZ81040.1 TIR domain-containing protein [Actinophytocola sp.]
MDVEAGRVEGAATLVFINYRSSDAASSAALLHAELSDRFGSNAVFLDYESMPLGEDFEQALLARVCTSAVLLIVVGDRWLDGEFGQRPIDSAGDWVRREILTALEHGVPVVPVLFGGEVDPERLPRELAVLSTFQYFKIHRRQRADITALAEYLTSHIPRLDDSYRRVRSHAVLDHYHDVLDPLDDIHLTRRPWLVSRIEAFLDKEPRGYFFIEGKTGVGKTTFVAQFAVEHDHPHHFVSNTGERRTAAGALRGLATQLITRYELELDPEVAGDAVGFQAVLRLAAAAAADRGHKLVLVVDGLDLAVEHGDLPLALPATLPDNAYVVATAREGVALYARERPYDHVRIEPGSADNEDDIRRHIDETLRADAPLRALVEAKLPLQEFRDALARRCAGVWIYLRHVLADVRSGRVAPDDLQSLPPDVWTFYSRTLNELTSTNDMVLPALSTLACAAEPLPLDTLVALTGIEDSPERVRELRAAMTGRVRAFLVIVGDGDDRYFTPLHDSAREYLLGERPDDTMTGDDQQLDLLATHDRIIARYLAALFGTAESIPAVATTDPTRLGDLDGGYGLRNLPGHLAAAGYVETLHELLTAELARPGEAPANAWFRAHEKHGAFAEYKASLALGRRLATEDTDMGLAEGGMAATVAREVRYALMTGSVESIAAGLRPGLVRALVEGRVWSPRVALGWIRAIENYATRVELVAALAEAQRAGDGFCLAGGEAWDAWQLVFPPLSKRAIAVAGRVLARLPRHVREPIVREQLALGLAAEFPYRAESLGMVGGALDTTDLERAVTAALELPDESGIGTALLGLIPHVPASDLVRIHHAVAGRPTPVHRWRQVHRALALRLAEERLLPDAVAAYLFGELVMLATFGDPEGKVDATRRLAGLVDEERRLPVLHAVLDRITTQPGQVDSARLVPLCEFLHGPPVDRALGLARGIGAAWARALTLAALVQAVPDRQRPVLAEEALKALPEPGSRMDLERDQSLRFLAGHARGKTVDAVRKAARGLEDWEHAVVVAVLSGAVAAGEAVALRNEAVDLAAACWGWRRAKALTGIAPHLDHHSRLRAMDLVSDIGFGLGQARYRADALDALAAHTRDEEEQRHAARAAGRVGDLRVQADVLAAMTGEVSWDARAALRARVEELTAALPAPERIEPLISLAGHSPEEDRAGVLRRAADLLPMRPEAGHHGFAAQLAAVRPVLTEREIHGWLAEAVHLVGDEDAMDVWRVLGRSLAPGRATDKFWKALRKRMRAAPENRFGRYLAMMAPLVDADEVDTLRSRATELDARHRLLPLAAVACRLDGPDRRRLVGELQAYLPTPSLAGHPGPRQAANLQPYTVGFLAEAMTDTERDRLLDLALEDTGLASRFFDVLAALLPHLSESQRARASAAGMAVLPTQAALPGLDFTAVARHATPQFLYALLAATRFAPEHPKSRAITATLAARPDASVYWHKNIDGLGSVRELLSGLGRPGLLTVLAAAAPVIAREGGRRTSDECVTAIDDVVRWWP